MKYGSNNIKVEDISSFRQRAKTEHLAEEYECAMKFLDNLKVPRENYKNEVFSIVGRITVLMKMVNMDNGSYKEMEI